MKKFIAYPDAVNPELVGKYSPLAKAGGGYVWDDVLEYRVWCHPERGAPDIEDGNDYYHAFATYAEAVAFGKQAAKPRSYAAPKLETKIKTKGPSTSLRMRAE